MKARNLLDTTPTPEDGCTVKPSPLPMGPDLPRWMEHPRKTIAMAKAAELIYAVRYFQTREMQARADREHFIGDGNHMAVSMHNACIVAGTTIEHVTAKSTLGTLLRGGDRVAKRREVFAILRRAGYSLPEIAAAFGTNHSTVMTSLKGIANVEPKRTWAGPYQAQDAA
jgi:hypothetical protein